MIHTHTCRFSDVVLATRWRTTELRAPVTILCRNDALPPLRSSLRPLKSTCVRVWVWVAVGVRRRVDRNTRARSEPSVSQLKRLVESRCSGSSLRRWLGLLRVVRLFSCTYRFVGVLRPQIWVLG